MAKIIRPHKIVIGFDESGKFNEGIFIYQMLDDSGETSGKYNTLKINSEINVPIMNGMIQKAITFAKKQENINE